MLELQGQFAYFPDELPTCGINRLAEDFRFPDIYIVIGNREPAPMTCSTQYVWSSPSLAGSFTSTGG